MKNVFELWRDGGYQLPIKVSRESWLPNTFVTVVYIDEVKETKTGLYGKAYVCEDWYEGKVAIKDAVGRVKLLECAGCYQWWLVR